MTVIAPFTRISAQPFTGAAFIKPIIVPGPTNGGGASSLSQLTDVNASAPSNGDTLVYDELTQKYIVQPLDAQSLIGIVDGGEF